MQILFNKSVVECRQLGARGGRAYARNLRFRQSQAQPVSAGIKQRHFRRFCSWEAAPLAGTRYALYMSF